MKYNFKLNFPEEEFDCYYFYYLKLIFINLIFNKNFANSLREKILLSFYLQLTPAECLQSPQETRLDLIPPLGIGKQIPVSDSTLYLLNLHLTKHHATSTTLNCT